MTSHHHNRNGARRPRTRLSHHERHDLERLAITLHLQGYPPWEIAADLAEQAHITLLWAWRLSKGWTREELLQRLRRVDPCIDQSMLWRWEAGDRTPSFGNLDLLCQVYQTRPDRLGYGHDYTPTLATSPEFQPARHQPVGTSTSRPAGANGASR